MVLSRVVLLIPASLIGHLSIKINAYLLLLRAVKTLNEAKNAQKAIVAQIQPTRCLKNLRCLVLLVVLLNTCLG